MPKRIDLTGQVFGRLTVIEEAGIRRGNILWRCRCECGGQSVTPSYFLRTGAAQSCGCLHKETFRAAAVKSRTTHGMSKTPTYRSWASMRLRCLNPKASNADRYSQRGISICKRWDSFESFLADMGERPSGTTLDRIDSTGNYTPTNCRWATPTEQQNNTSANIIVEFGGERRSIAQWAKKAGCNWSTIRRRLKSGWSIERALTQPARKP